MDTLRSSAWLALGVVFLVACGGGESNSAAQDDPSVQAGPDGKADNPNATVSCSWDTPTYLPADAYTLADHVVTSMKVTINNKHKLTNVEARQLYAAVELVGLLDSSDGEGLDAVFPVADEGSFEFMTFEYEGMRGQWVRFYAGRHASGRHVR